MLVIEFGRAGLLPSALLALVLGWTGCSDDGAANPGTGGMGGSSTGGAASGGGGSSSTGGAGAGPLGAPLLERSGELGYDCSVSAKAQLLDLPTTDSFVGGLSARDGKAWLAWGDSPDWDATDRTVKLQVGELSLAAQLGAVGTVAQGSNSYTSAALLPNSDGLSLFAIHQTLNRHRILLSALDANGHAQGEPRVVYEAPEDVGRLLVAQGTTRIGLVWSERIPGDTGKYQLRFGFLSADGEFSLAPLSVGSSASWAWPGAITGTDSGFLVSYVENHWDGTSARQVVAVRHIAEDGSVGAAHELTGSPHDGAYSQSLLWRDGEALLARSWTEGSYENEQLGSTVLLARLDGTGRRVAEEMRLQAWTRSQVNYEPFLFERGGDIGLLWSQGSFIYICAGCMPDNHLEFVLLDGETFTPKSARLQLTNPATAGGLINPEAVVLGDDLVISSRVGYHVSSELAAGAIRCTERE